MVRAIDWLDPVLHYMVLFCNIYKCGLVNIYVDWERDLAAQQTRLCDYKQYKIYFRIVEISIPSSDKAIIMKRGYCEILYKRIEEKNVFILWMD